MKDKEFEEIMASQIKTHKDYKIYLITIKKFSFL
jgi:hypothetical protein